VSHAANLAENKTGAKLSPYPVISKFVKFTIIYFMDIEWDDRGEVESMYFE
jgi:hypothetical protein